jgi:hypothetical protein
LPFRRAAIFATQEPLIMRFELDSTSLKNNSFKTRRVQRSVQRAVRTTLESLESRRLLASVAAGQVGIYEGPNGPVRITVDGSGNFDFIGATRDENGNARLNDIPMTIYDAGTGDVIREILGGYGGRDGIEPIQEVTGDVTDDDSRMVGPDFPYQNLPNGLTSIGGLATNVKGRTYGVNVYQNGPTESVVDILGVNNDTGATTIHEQVTAKVIAAIQAVAPDFRDGDINSVIGADFDPADENTLFFALNVDFPFVTGGGTTPTVTRKATPAMFQYNVRTGNLTLDTGFFGVGAQEDNFRIDDFTFNDDGDVLMFGSVQRAGDAQADVGLFISDKDNVIASFLGPVTTGPAQTPVPVLALAAMEFIPGEDYIIGVSDRTGTANLVRIDIPDLSAGAFRMQVIGSAVDPDDGAQTNKRGSNIGDLSFNTRLVDGKFSIGKRGVLLGTDTAKDELVAYDSRERFQTPDLYAIYGDNVNSDTSLSIADMTPDPRDIPLDDKLFLGELNPYTGSPGSIRTTMPANTLLPLANGEVYIGIRVADQTNAITVPILELSSVDDFAGAKPGVSLPKTVRPGVYIKGSVNDILIGGTITGSVNIDGSVDTFYAGNVITGDPLNGVSNSRDNFFVNGDIRNLVVSGGLGTLAGAADEFKPNTDILVNGKIQMIKTGVNYRGSMDIAGKTSEITIGDSVIELETTVDTRVPNAAGRSFAGPLAGPGHLQGPGLGGNTDKSDFAILNAVTENDTFDTPQVLGSYYSKARRMGGQVTVQGSINNGTNFGDGVDYYGVPLLAGQTIQVGVVSESGLTVFLSVIDPEGRTYATDISNQAGSQFLNTRLSVRADKPGLWRLAVTAVEPALLVNAFRPYLLTVDKVGDTTLGGLVSVGNTYFDQFAMGLRVRSGDLGAILAGGRVEGADVTDIGRSREPNLLNPIVAQKGNIRSIEGTSISRFQNGVYSLFPNIVSSGSVGLVRADTFVYFNNQLNAFSGRPAKSLTIGGDYQLIEAGGDFSANLSTNKGIGVIRVGSFAQSIRNLPGYIAINADDKGSDGEVGLIDVVGDFGTFTFGGPAFFVGEGSNIRYLRVGGTAYRDYFFGSGSTTVLTGRNTAVKVRDDSGAEVTIRPYAGTQTTSTAQPGDGTTDGGGGGGTQIPDPFGGNGPGTPLNNGIPNPFGPNNPGSPTVGIPDPFGGNGPGGGTGTDDVTISDIFLGDIAVTTYPVRSGGSVIMSVETTTGLTVDVSKRGGGGSGDIAQVFTSATGLIPQLQDTGGTVSLPPGVPLVDQSSLNERARLNPTRLGELTYGTGVTFDLLFRGGRVNVFEINDPPPPPETTLEFSRIVNFTDGEIVNIEATSVGYLEAEHLGVSRDVASVKLEGLLPATDIRFDTNFANLYPFQGAKNMIFLTNAIDVVSRGPLGNIAVDGTIQNLRANSDGKNVRGVYEGIVGPVIATNPADEATDTLISQIRRVDVGEGLAYSGSGSVSFAGLYSDDSIGLVTNVNGNGDIRGDIIVGNYFEGLRLTGGSVIDAEIYQSGLGTSTGFSIGNENFIYGLNIVGPPILNTLLFGLGDISITGNGGIINSRIAGYNIGKISVAGTGFGMFNTTVLSSSGATMQGASIGGLGIRNSEISGGSFLKDVVATGTGKLRSVSEFSNSARVSEFAYFDAMSGTEPNAATDLNLYLGTTKRKSKITGTTEDGVIQDSIVQSSRDIDNVKAFEIRAVNNGGTRPTDEVYVSQINAADRLGSVTTLRNMNGVRIVGGTIGTISAGRDMTLTRIQANERVKTISAGRHMLGSVGINLTGDGSLDLLKTGGNLSGTAFAARGIRTIDVGGNLGTAFTQGGIRSGADINLLRVRGDVSGTGYVRADRTIKLIDIGGDIEEDAVLRAKSVTEQQIDGVVYGDIVIG